MFEDDNPNVSIDTFEYEGEDLTGNKGARITGTIRSEIKGTLDNHPTDATSMIDVTTDLEVNGNRVSTAVKDMEVIVDVSEATGLRPNPETRLAEDLFKIELEQTRETPDGVVRLRLYNKFGDEVATVGHMYDNGILIGDPDKI